MATIYGMVHFDLYTSMDRLMVVISSLLCHAYCGCNVPVPSVLSARLLSTSANNRKACANCIFEVRSLAIESAVSSHVRCEI